MSKQTLFNTSYTHVMRQGEPSIDTGGECVYQGVGDIGCGARPFILEYTPEMEDTCWQDLVDMFESSIELEAIEEADFVQKLQEAHDLTAINTSRVGTFCEEYHREMCSIAEEYELIVPDLTKIGG